MRIVVVGVNGNVGSRTVEAALAAGHEVVAYVRRPESIGARQGLTVAVGGATDAMALATVAEAADAVIVSITGATKDSTFMQRTLPAVIEAVRRAGACRLALVSVFGAGDTADKASWFARLVYRRALGTFLADKAASDKILQDSGLAHTTCTRSTSKTRRPCPRRASTCSAGWEGAGSAYPSVPERRSRAGDDRHRPDVRGPAGAGDHAPGLEAGLRRR